MELLLKSDIEKLGRVGDVVTVRTGYARNYLLPLGLAVPVTAANKQEIDTVRAAAFAAEKARIEDLKEMSNKLQDVSVTIEGKANDEGHLFGSVAAPQIALALKDKGFPIEAKAVRLDHPLKEIGVFDVPVHLHADVEATIKVWVVQSKPS